MYAFNEKNFIERFAHNKFSPKVLDVRVICTVFNLRRITRVLMGFLLRERLVCVLNFKGYKLEMGISSRIPVFP